MPPSSPTGAAEPVRSPIPLSAIADTISRLRFGAVTLTVQDGRLVQMDVTERQRFS
ncbi:MAG: YezD family protein [Blastomonas fulva]|uniref:YezD family protein n=1 Tax=Blastomonas fulva TaxID=1550728 RepID=UPI004034E506